MTINDFRLSPYKQLTEELIDSLIIHLTVSSLRRAGSVSPKIVRIEGTGYIPTLYYIKGSRDPNKSDWTVHALQSDLSRFMLHTIHIELPTTPPTLPPTEPPTISPQPVLHSKIRWDKVTGGNLQEYVDGGMLILSGDISWDDRECPPGNYVCAIIRPHPHMIKLYPDATVTFDGKTKPLSEMLFGPEFSICPLVHEPGEEFPIELKWDDDFIEHFVIAITQESHLL